jgi:hypothetical protein
MEQTDNGNAAGPAPATTKSAPLVPLHKYTELHLETRRDLAVNQAEIAKRINSDPALSVLLLINPVLAFKEFGVTVSPEVSKHIMHTLRYLPAVQDKHDALQTSLSEALGETPRPTDPAWLARTLFDKLKVQPLDTQGLTPAYKTPLDADAMQRLQQLLPQQKPRYPNRQKLIPIVSSVRVAPPPPAVRALDLDAALPASLPKASTAPATVTLTDLYFYKDSNPIARQLLEYGMTIQLAIAFHTPATFRAVRDGTQSDPFRAWIQSVQISGTKS